VTNAFEALAEPCSAVIAGLDPTIHLLAKKMDPRVKLAGDRSEGVDRPESALRADSPTMTAQR